MNAPALIELPAQRRAASIRAASFDEATNSVEVVWTAGAKVRRYSWRDDTFYDEELIVEPNAIRLDRLNSGTAPLLDTHDDRSLASVIGVVIAGSVTIRNGQGFARVQLSSSPDVAAAVAKIREGTVRGISVGYRIHKIEKTEADDGLVPIWRIVDWEPLEISAVAVPADPAAAIRAGAELYSATIFRKDGQMTEPTPPGELALERTRAATIADLGRQFGQADFAAEAIRNGTALDAFRRALNDKLVEDQDQNSIRSQVGASLHYGSPAGATDFEQRRAAAMQSAILHRVDPARNKLEAGAEVFMSMPLLEIARASVEARGIRTAGMSKMIIAGEALGQRSGGMHTTTDFPAILANVTNRTLRAAYETAPQTFRPLVRETTVSDFREVTRAQISEAPSLEKVNEHGEFKSGTMGDSAEKYRLETFGRIIGITRQAIVNDDLSAFDRIPRAFGVQAAQLESDLVWGQILLNAAMGDGVALFHANHSNLLTSGAISETTVAEARKKMGLQTGLDGNTALNLSPDFLIVPKALEVAALKFVTSITPAKTADAVPSEIRNLTVIAEPRLDLGVTRYGIAGSATAYYFATSPTFVDVVELAYLEGARGVYTETRAGFEIDGIQIKARLDVAAKVIDWRGVSKNAGA